MNPLMEAEEGFWPHYHANKHKEPVSETPADVRPAKIFVHDTNFLPRLELVV